MNPGDHLEHAQIHRWVWDDPVTLPDPTVIVETSEALRVEGAIDLAAALLDRAWGRHPTHAALHNARAALLDHLAIDEHGVRFRYIPAGWYRQGSEEGDADERPRRRVELDAFWIASEPLTWVQVASLGDLTAPPELRAKDDPPPGATSRDRQPLIDPFAQRIIAIYSQTSEGIALDPAWVAAAEKLEPWQREAVIRSLPESYGVLPAVGLRYATAERVAKTRSNSVVEYALPTEAQWERAARGGLRDARYPWGDAEPSPRLADYDQFERFKLRSVRELVPNGYGLFGMAGSCYEWCSDWYDALEYQQIAKRNPTGPTTGKQRVARGGSWADASYALRVSFRAAYDSDSPWWVVPTVGMRPIRRPRSLAR